MACSFVEFLFFLNQSCTPRFCCGCRKVNGSFLKESLEARALTTVPGGTLLAISSATRVQGEFGDFALANFSAVIGGKKEVGRVKIPNSILENTSMTPPCFLLYKGMKPTKAGRTCHSASAYVCDGLSAANLEEKAAELRKMSYAALDALMSAQTLDSFPAGTMFLTKNVVRKVLRKGEEERLMVEFETVMGSTDVKGTLLLPARLESQVKQDDAVILWYGGMKPSTRDGKLYHDIKVLDEAMATAIIKGSESQTGF